MEWLAALLGPIIRPIIREEVAEIKQWALDQSKRLDAYKKYDNEAQELMEEMANASTTEHKRAILRKLAASRPTL